MFVYFNAWNQHRQIILVPVLLAELWALSLGNLFHSFPLEYTFNIFWINYQPILKYSKFTIITIFRYHTLRDLSNRVRRDWEGVWACNCYVACFPVFVVCCRCLPTDMINIDVLIILMWIWSLVLEQCWKTWCYCYWGWQVYSCQITCCGLDS